MSYYLHYLFSKYFIISHEINKLIVRLYVINMNTTKTVLKYLKIVLFKLLRNWNYLMK